MFRDWLYALSEPVIAAIDLMALVLIAGATVYTFFAGLWMVVTRGTVDGHERRTLWLAYARWLVVGLTFQLAADIIESSIAPSWEAIGQLGAIAVIRTFLDYFLERDVAEIRERDHVSLHRAAPEDK
ncbi:DUF1622 domain-containing protein [Pseudoxanthomonas daejeonensis]|uniref:DUF1622 domain-containing protein n=1 Tax=Pseudoxanthomonas daejeonensis TaxID=266062 RepID=A0ABQ6Z3G1_9GAMM|nr:DUF1622 domain-containing protein [Pseudoxanthomonas daejeonensis]KAF1691957.1 hypothetical protein CSC65_15625 [Pseudoxanthomonas daejeonensis]